MVLSMVFLFGKADPATSWIAMAVQSMKKDLQTRADHMSAGI
jgi:hypothetical protein